MNYEDLSPYNQWLDYQKDSFEKLVDIENKKIIMSNDIDRLSDV